MIQIILPYDLITTIDEADADLAAKKWRTNSRKKLNNPRCKHYACRSNRSGRITLHRLIMSRMLGRDLAHDEMVDHIDGNSLNNCRGNLRLCTPAQNNANTGKYANNRSGFKGVSLYRNRWRAVIVVKRRQIYLGLYDTPEAAHQAYREATQRYYGEFGRAK